jgi:hypothetical protein
VLAGCAQQASCSLELLLSISIGQQRNKHNFRQLLSSGLPTTRQRQVLKATTRYIRSLATMSSSLLRPPSHLPPPTALQLSQQASKIIKEAPGAVSTSVLQSLFSASETPELWIIYENLLLSCLRTGDEEAAHQCLGRLINRFGDENERIMAFVGLLKEADAQDDATLEVVLKEYQAILEKTPTNIVCCASLCYGRSY